MAVLDFNQGAAEAWMQKAEELNGRCKTYVEMVGNCLNTLKANSIGDAIDELGVAGAQVINASATLISSLSAIVTGIRGIFNKLVQASMEMVADVAANKSAITLGK